MTRSQADHSVFFKKTRTGIVILVVYVDDIVITGSDKEGIQILINHLSSSFLTKDLGKLRYFLGIEVARSKAGISLSQRAKIYPRHSTRHRSWKEISFIDHLVISALKVILMLTGQGHLQIEILVRSSTTGYCTFIGGNLVTWRSKKLSQLFGSLFSAEAEYRAMAHTTCELTWLRTVLQEFGLLTQGPTPLYCDNQAAIHIDSYSNPVRRHSFWKGIWRAKVPHKIRMFMWKDHRSKKYFLFWPSLSGRVEMIPWLNQPHLEASLVGPKAVAYAEEFFAANKRVESARPISENKWLPPPSLHVKLNIAWKRFPTRNSFGVGSVIRDHTGGLSSIRERARRTIRADFYTSSVGAVYGKDFVFSHFVSLPEKLRTIDSNSLSLMEAGDTSAQGEIPNPGQGQNGGEGLRNEEGRNQNLDQNDEGSSANQNRVPHPSQIADPTRSAVDARAAKLGRRAEGDEWQQMKEMKSQVKAKAAKNLDMLVHRTESPFTKRVDEYPLLAKFKVPQLETFDGFKDPLDYLDSFRTVMKRLRSTSQTKYVALTAFNAGLRKGDFLFQLCKEPPKSMSKLMYEAQKFINAEDAFEARDEFPSRKRKESEDDGSSSQRKERSKGFTPLNMSIDQVLLQIQDDLEIKWPGKLRSNSSKRSKDLYYRFRRDHGHNTEDCYALKEQIETLIRQGKLRKFVRRDNQEARPEPRPPRQDENKDHTENHPQDIIGEIRTIVRGLALGGFITRRVLIDNGSSADIIYLPAYKQMKINKERLRPIDIPLVGFTGDKVRPSGVVSLVIEAGTYPKQVRTPVEFLVVDCPSAYNVIIGRPTLNKLRVVTSTYHLLVRFPTEHGIGEHKRDQGNSKGKWSCWTTKNPTKPRSIGTKRDGRLRESMIKFLKDNFDVFAWMHNDMPGIDPSAICHKLNVSPSFQAHKIEETRVLAPDRNQAISDEVEKLLMAGFIRRGLLPRLASQCRHGEEIQRQMEDDDQEKTSFITSKGLFCYKAMPFGLKNTGATYQRLMNKMFHNQIGRNVEVYIDEHVGKIEGRSKSPGRFGRNIRDTSPVSHEAQPERGIEANPDKIKAVLEMTPPRMVKEVQNLTGRVATLNRFISRATDKCLPFFKTLRKAFTWTDKFSPTAVNSALIREEGGTQLPVYYTSKAFQGAEERYPAMEKLTLALVIAARKLRPYFQSHKIVVLTNHLLRKVMNKPDATGRLIQWAVELSEFDIEYRLRKNQKENGKSKLTDRPSKGQGGVGMVFKTPKGPSTEALRAAPISHHPTNESRIRGPANRPTCSQRTGGNHTQNSKRLTIDSEDKVNGEFEAKEDRNGKNTSELVKSIIGWFDEVTLVQVPQNSVKNWVYAITTRPQVTLRPTNRTNSKNSHQEKPHFELTYGTEAVILVEIGVTTWRTNHHDEGSNDNLLRTNLDLLDEARDQAEAKTRAYQQRMARYYDRHLKHREFKVGDLVLRKVTLATKDPA
uniref:RNA-directed DNA polymerase n=1 Tax=Fagus sylvatica TaxID=28930 RepID=A0A2N9G040_FAGSY